MNFNPNPYLSSLNKQKTNILEILQDKDWERKITTFSLISHIPLLAVYAYIIRPEVGAPTAQVRIKIARVLDFYNYDSLLPWDDLNT